MRSMAMPSRTCVFVMPCLMALALFGASAATRPLTSSFDGDAKGLAVIKPTFAGYLPVSADGSALYYAYYEAAASSEDLGEAPIVLWLQGGPGCASTFGGFYELGPFSVTPDLGVVRNKGAWNRIFGLLLFDQPVGTGYSVAANGSASIPTDEMGVAVHAYAALQQFFTQHRGLQPRPLFITGESYAGKYVPSITHYILQLQEATQEGGQYALGEQQEQRDGQNASPVLPYVRLQRRRPLPPGTRPSRPLFRLMGAAIGNGLTDPRSQTLTLASAAYFHGLLPPAQRDEVAARAAAVVALVDEGKWEAAQRTREQLRSYITEVAGLGTMFDTRRTTEYDPTKSVDRFLNLPEVKEAMRARRNITYVSCSDAVRDAMRGDVMRSVKDLLPDVLHHIHVLLYQGQFDILDGVASVSAWVSSLDWDDQGQFNADRGRLWHVPDDTDARVGHVAGPGRAWSSDARAHGFDGGVGGGAEVLAGAGSAAGSSTWWRRSGLSVPAALQALLPWSWAGGRGQRHPSLEATAPKDADLVVAGWRRGVGRLQHWVVYRAGHMVPRDQPVAARQMLEEWALGVLEEEGGGTQPGAGR